METGELINWLLSKYHKFNYRGNYFTISLSDFQKLQSEVNEKFGSKEEIQVYENTEGVSDSLEDESGVLHDVSHCHRSDKLGTDFIGESVEGALAYTTKTENTCPNCKGTGMAVANVGGQRYISDCIRCGGLGQV